METLQPIITRALEFRFCFDFPYLNYVNPTSTSTSSANCYAVLFRRSTPNSQLLRRPPPSNWSVSLLRRHPLPPQHTKPSSPSTAGLYGWKLNMGEVSSSSPGQSGLYWI
ncbi:hypothetical protein R6Q57_017158 [Mikania cordata]